jgi:hypothetical protein
MATEGTNSPPQPAARLEERSQRNEDNGKIQHTERHAFPWPCFVDLDDEFGVFHKHGTQNSALFFIDHDGTIIAVPNSVEELKAKLKEIFNDNK